jgi:uncharacterized membrane protein YcaP (DUF421 family)
METVIRVVLIYLFLLAAMRVIGKREFGELSPHEFVVLLMIPEIVSVTLNQNDRTITNGVIGACTIFAMVVLTSVLAHRSPRIEKIVTDTAAVLVHRGHMFEEIMNKERMTPEEIMTEARKSGIESMDQIRWAVLEADGKIAIIPEDGQKTSGTKDD